MSTRTRASSVVPVRLVTEALRRARRVPLIVVTAGPGYGKTTALTHWTDHDDRRFAWVSIDERDDDGARLARRLVRAGAGTRRSVLVVDDLHRLRDGEAWRVLARTVTDLPEGAQIVLCGRTRPRIPLARRQLRGDVVVIGPAELAMAPAAAAALLGQNGVSLPDGQRDALIETCEGWPAGLVLAASALAELPPTAQLASAVNGRHHLVRQYMTEEILDTLGADTVDFLLGSSVLDVLSAGAVDAVLDRRDSGSVLDGLETSGLPFFIPIDGERRWYRHHHLFAQFLRAELHRRDPRRAHELHRRASRWCEQHHRITPAIRHARHAGDVGRAGALIQRHAASYIGRRPHRGDGPVDRGLARSGGAPLRTPGHGHHLAPAG